MPYAPAGNMFAASGIIAATSTGSPNLTDISTDGRPGPTLAAAVIGVVSLSGVLLQAYPPNNASDMSLPLANITQTLVFGPADSAFQGSVVQATGR